jgi:hypothetical protein
MLTFSSPAFAIDPALSVDNFTELLVQQHDPVLQLRDEGFSQADAERQVEFCEVQLEDVEFRTAIIEPWRGLPPSSPIASTSSLPNPQPMPSTATAFTMGKDSQ